MKRVLITGILLCSLFYGSKAQYVTIPDATFVTWLQNNGFAGCMNGNQLDTTCQAVLNATAFNITTGNLNIASLQGVYYFKHLDTLIISQSKIDSLNDLPLSLKYLDCSAGRLLSHISYIPDSLTYLWIWANKLTSLPTLPASLQYINVVENQLPALPNWPNGLIFAMVGGNPFYTLPATLPPGLQYLDCMVDSLTSLPTLPSTLGVLRCGYNQLTSLPTLPASLYQLYCWYDGLTSLPTLPAGLAELWCQNNQLTALPVLPPAMVSLMCDSNHINSISSTSGARYGYFSCRYNQLTSLPDSMILGTQYYNGGLFDCSHNQLTALPRLVYDSIYKIDCSYNPGLTCLPALAKGDSLYYGNTAISCLPDHSQILHGVPAFNTVPTCATNNAQGCIAGPVTAHAGNDTAICGAGASVLLGANPTASGGTPPYTYQWSPTTTLSSASVPNPVAVPSTTTTYTITITDSTGVQAFDTVKVTVGQGATAMFSASLICAGSPTTLIDHSTPGGSITSWAWDFNNDGVTDATTQNPNYTFPAVGTYPVKLTVTGPTVCTADTTINVVVQAAPTSTFTATSPMCTGGNSTITYTGNASGSATYNWNFNGGTIASGTNQGPYQVNWATGGTKNITLLVTENGCSSTFTTVPVVVNPNLILDSFAITNANCSAGNNGAICIYVSGGLPTYTYVWSNSGGLTQCITGLASGFYNVTVTDADGCTGTFTGNVSQTGAPVVGGMTTTDVPCFGMSNGSMCANITGGTPPYTYIWSDAATTLCITNMSAGTYVLTVTDANNCTSTALGTINQPSQLVAAFTATGDTIHFGQTDTLTQNASGGTPPYAYTWSQGSATFFIPVTICGTYSGTVTDANNCTAYVIDSTLFCTFDNVWPGDANFDGIVDNNDLLPIGLGYGTTGPIRPNASLNWIGQPATDWVDTLLGGVNYKNVDCDGSGTIDATDTLAIIQNYSLTHTRSGGMDEWRSGIPALTFTMVPDTLVDSETVVVTLSLGDSNNVANNVYGLAFTFNYDPLVVDSSSVNITFGNSWLCSTGDHIDISKNFGTQGKLEAALTRIDHTTRSGYGNIGTVAMRITAGNINGKNLQYYTFKCFISNLVVIDNAGHRLPFNEGNDSAQIAYVPTGIHEVQNDQSFIKIFPNPAFDQLTVSSTAASIMGMKVTNVIGETVIPSVEVNALHSILNCSQLSAGTYILYLQTEMGEYHHKFIKIK